MVAEVSAGLILSPSFGTINVVPECSYLPVLDPAVLYEGLQSNWEQWQAWRCQDFTGFAYNCLKQTICYEEVNTVSSYHTSVCWELMTCLCTPAVGSVYGFNGAIFMDVWHSDMPQSARKAPTDEAFSHMAALALGPFCSFFPGGKEPCPTTMPSLLKHKEQNVHV